MKPGKPARKWLELRIAGDDLDTIKRAACLRGDTLSGFVRTTVLARAEDLIAVAGGDVKA